MDPFVAQLLLVPYNFAPRGWAFCQGQIMSIAQNTALFSLIGTFYGGNGTSTFGLPDLRGRAALGQGQGPGLSDYAIGELSGTENVTLLQTEMPFHSHTPQGVAQHGNQASPINFALSDAVDQNNTPLNLYAAGTPTIAMNPGAISLSGNNVPHNNLMPFLALNWVIALSGVFPTRP